jgi:RsiW-degrading membrane proteinase PrsW (M82 family)
MLQTPGIIVAAAVVPPLGYAVLVALLDRRRPRPWLALAAAFLWGVVAAAFAAAPLNDLLLDRLSGATGEARARALAATAGAPLLEELLKGLGPLLLVLLRPDLLRTARDGIICGALVGLGFDLAENVQYLTLAAVQGGVTGLVRGVWVRGVLAGLKHAVFTGTTGAGLGWAREVRGRRARLLIPLLALAAAVAQHAAWNAVASHAITRALCGAPGAEAACLPAPSDLALFVSVPLIVALCVGPGALALAAIARRRGAAVTALLALVVLAPAPASGDGGTVRLVERSGGFVITVFSAPEPLRVGPADLSVLVQDEADAAPVLDARISLEAVPPAGAAGVVRLEATRAHATNKLLYATPFTPELPGAWTLGVRVQRGTDVAEARTVLPVGPARSGLWSLWPYLALPPAAVALYALAAWLSVRRHARPRDLA